MNYSTLKKTVVLSFVSLMAVGMAQAQTTTADTSKSAGGPAKVFGGASQYSTWSVGINAGLTSALIPFQNNVVDYFKADIGYGVNIKDQLTHSIAIRFDYLGGTVEGTDQTTSGTGASSETSKYGGTYFSTGFNSFNLSGVADIGSVSFLKRKSGIILYVSAGLGLDIYTPKYSTAVGATSTSQSYSNSVKELDAPVGSGLKFKLSDALDLDLGYTMTFLDNYNFAGYKSYPSGADGYQPGFKSHYAYTYAGLDYTFGTKSKPSLEWANPVAMMYDELYDAALRQEVEALKGRVANVETAITDLKKDSDGDGVSDQFDKCPNTTAGTVVDGSGCPLVLPPPIDTSLFVRKTSLAGPATVAAYSNIQFEFDSSVLKTSSYPVLDATSADLRSSGASAELDGYASSEGTAAHNMRLSKDRAESVKTYLVNSGVPAKKLKVKGFGETHPVADNSTEAGRILNRRVEFKKK
jgi:OOP family OmpA-OmpF porin